jgi:hypothetical protein
MNIIQAIEDKNLLGSAFKDLSTWRPWMIFLKALFGLEVQDSADLELFRQCTELAMPPKERIRECAAICGRRSGKSYISAIIAVYLACFKDWTQYLSPGEKGMIIIVAVDRSQAKIIKQYVSGILNSSRVLAGMVQRDLPEQIDLKNRVSIVIKTNSYRSVRGFSILCAILEETAFWRSDFSSNPDREVVAAIKPSLATIPESLMIMISTPYARRGILYDTFKRSFGQPGKNFVWLAPSIRMNPGLDAEIIKEALVEDPQAAAAEWQCVWRPDLETFLSFESVSACVIPDRVENPPIWDTKYTAFIDPSGGGQDSFTLAIAHTELNGNFRVLDLVRERRPPFSPDEVVAEISALIKAYRCFEVVSDRFSRQWVQDSFKGHGINVQFSPLSASELYLEFLPMVTARSCELPDNKRLIGQLANLERRVRSGGRDLIAHFPGQHDDLANSAAGALYFTSKSLTTVWRAL